jgi:hypothetical protein
VVRVVEHFPSKYKVLSSNSSTTKKKSAKWLSHFRTIWQFLLVNCNLTSFSIAV